MIKVSESWKSSIKNPIVIKYILVSYLETLNNKIEISLKLQIKLFNALFNGKNGGDFYVR